MARKPAVERLDDLQREHLIADIMRGELSWRQLAAKYGIPEGTLRGWAEREKLERNPSGLKRELVAQAMAKPDPKPEAESAQTARESESTQGSETAQQSAQRATTTPPTLAEVEEAAAEDARDMRAGLAAARLALVLVGKRLKAAQADDGAYTPRDIKVLSESVAINVGTIRTIRGLDAVLNPQDLRNMSDEDLERMTQGKAPRST